MKHLTLAFLLSLTALGPAFAQPSPSEPSVAAPTASEAAFEKLKTLAGTWVGPISVTPAADDAAGMFAHIELRVTSRGNAIAHEISPTGFPDHPVTMFYLDGDAIYGTHYCDAGNRPRFEGTLSPDGKRLEFEFVDLSGSDAYGHMQRAVFTFVDENHHIEEWTFKMPNGEFTGRFDVRRTNMPTDTASSH